MSGKERSSNAAHRRYQKVLVFLLKLLALAVPFHVAISYADLSALQQFTASNVHAFLGLFGIKSALNGAVLRFDGFDVLVSRDSTGWKSVFFLTALILASEAKIGHKIAGVLLFVPAIYVVNVVRIAITAYSAFFGVDMFVLFHDFLWQVGMTLAVIAMWVVWFMRRNAIYDTTARTLKRLKTAL
ncbi:MAG: archaeosortase/exosortase family protein [Candidatus Aenigmarchaeota archaeon]|nr:archaeosortase/exosortase family protein [Candidatus Aenigmarchaeota archaeon]